MTLLPKDLWLKQSLLKSWTETLYMTLKMGILYTCTNRHGHAYRKEKDIKMAKKQTTLKYV